MQCQCEHGEKHDFTPCPNEATESVKTPYGALQLCNECAEDMRLYLNEYSTYKGGSNAEKSI
jgi:hypothetical protein